jgi:hypothetical protein
MNAPTKVDPTGGWPEGELATATDFVRHFGHYAASSRRKPVYIAQHGRVGWALLSAAEMTRLSETGSDTSTFDARFDILLDSISTIVVLVDADFRITRMNSAGRRHYEVPHLGSGTVSLLTLLSDNNRHFIGDICSRVLSSGNTETFELESGRYRGRTLHFQIMPFPSGLAILADVVTEAAEGRRVSAAAAAASQAVDAIVSLGRGQLDVRGAIVSLNNNLAELAQSTKEKVMGLRLAALFEQESRTRVRDAIDDLLTNGTAFSMKAAILNGTATPIQVTLGAGAERERGSISGAAFVLIPRI